MTSIINEFRNKGQLNWIMKAEGDKLTAFHNGKRIGTYNKRYVMNQWRLAFGYTMPESLILAANYVQLKNN